MDLDFMLRLRYAMQDKNMTASELSRLSGVGKSDISYYLKGRYVPKQDKCYLLAKALNVDPMWLMTGINPKTGIKEYFSEPNSFNNHQSEQERKKQHNIEILFRGVNRMTPENVERVLAVVEAMFDKGVDLFSEKDGDD